MVLVAQWFDLAVRHHLDGDLIRAEQLYRQILDADPQHAHALSNLGVVLARHSRFGDAAACFRQALAIDPTHPDASRNLASALRDHGDSLKAQQKSLEAAAAYEQALSIDADCVQTLTNLGAVYVDMASFAKAATCFQRAIELKPDSSTFHGNLAVALQEQGKLEEAVAAYQRALQLDPNNRAAVNDLVHLLQHLCRWPEVEELLRSIDERFRTGQGASRASLLSPFTILSLPTPSTAAEQLECARNECAKYAVEPTQWLMLPGRPAGKTKITLGYLSVDYRKHAVAYLIAELFEIHDRVRFEVFGYSYGADDGSALRRRLEGSFDHFVDVRQLSFRETARRITADHVDILIDLTGYTKNHRAAILAMRPAPIQVNYLGHPGTMGASFMDYILVDDFIVPAEQQPFYTERLVQLPECYQVNDRQREVAASTPTRTECGLPAEGFVFADFNNTFKITPQMFDLWMNLLKAVSGSVLWLFEGNAGATTNLRREAAARGVAPERLVFAPRRPLPDHLARYRLVDLFLDTFPYGSLTTASDALWVGCPLLTLVGETFVSRVAASCLRTIGLPELATNSLAEYEAMALRLARDSALLAELRTRLAANRVTSRLFDTERFARSLESAYEVMWDRHVSGETPRLLTHRKILG